MRKSLFLFDLDGTIIDPKIGITKSVQYSLEAFGIHVADLDQLVRFIGPPLRESYREFYSMSAFDAENAVKKYREYFSEQGIYENTLYPGMEELLRGLRASERVPVLATSKPTEYAERILKYHSIAQYFAFVSGSEMDGARSDKRELIQYAMKNLQSTNISTSIMIGDRQHDILGAKRCGMESIGVLYGYGSREELANAGATYLAGSVVELSARIDHVTKNPAEA